MASDQQHGRKFNIPRGVMSLTPLTVIPTYVVGQLRRRTECSGMRSTPVSP